METIETNFLDVTVLDPREKHPTIFRTFDALKEGQTLTILNDHDPKPLYYQLIHERGNIFDWKYLENGPVWWRVSITMNREGQGRTPIGEIAAKDIRKAAVFKKYGIDFCCGGKRTLRDVCTDKGLDIVQIEKELQDQERSRDNRAVAYAEWSPDFLADYIVNTHHTYVEKMLPEINAYAMKVAEVHGPQHPELRKIAALVRDLTAELKDHMMKEERILFPFIKTLVLTEKENQVLPKSHFGSVNNPIKMMENEHENAGQLLEEIRSLSNDYTLPESACASYSLLFSMLQEFEQDLHIHIHLENNVLFPKAVALERKLSIPG